MHSWAGLQDWLCKSLNQMFKERSSEKMWVQLSLSVISSSHGAAARCYPEFMFSLKLLPERSLFFSVTPETLVLCELMIYIFFIHYSLNFILLFLSFWWVFETKILIFSFSSANAIVQLSVVSSNLSCVLSSSSTFSYPCICTFTSTAQ